MIQTSIAGVMMGLGLLGSAHCEGIRLPSMGTGNYKIYCDNEYSRRGKLDQDLFKYCMKKQSKGYRDLKAEVEMHEDVPHLQASLDDAIDEAGRPG